MKTVCPICGKEFEHYPSKPKTYCSHKCAWASKERSRNISLRITGRIPWNKGLTKEVDVRLKEVSESMTRMWKERSRPRTFEPFQPRGFCKRCFVRKSETVHHIIPRDSGGGEHQENKISLCFRCHDYVEIKTDEWIKSGKRYDVDLLRSLIVNDGF